VEESAPQTLRLDQLETLHALWAEQGAPIADRLRPGLPDEAIDGLTEPLAVRLPVEARTWWGWHDGTKADEDNGYTGELGPEFGFLTLAQAVREYRTMRAMFEDLWHGDTAETYDDPDYWWRPSWFPITNRRGLVRCDTAVPLEAPCPIYWAYSHDHDAEGLSHPRTASFGEMVSWWIEALQDGAWEYNRHENRWIHRAERVEAGRLRSGLV